MLSSLEGAMSIPTSHGRFQQTFVRSPWPYERHTLPLCIRFRWPEAHLAVALESLRVRRNVRAQLVLLLTLHDMEVDVAIVLARTAASTQERMQSRKRSAYDAKPHLNQPDDVSTAQECGCWGTDSQMKLTTMPQVPSAPVVFIALTTASSLMRLTTHTLGVIG